MITIIISAIVAILAVGATTYYFREMTSRLKEHIASLTSALNGQKANINELEIDNIKLKALVKSFDAVVSEKNHTIDKLTTINAELKRLNVKLLKQASDDVTVNVKAGDDATVIVPAKRKRGRPKKKSNNGRSATNNNQVQKGKQ